MRRTVDQSMLPNRQCDAPDAKVVTISDRWTEADAHAGATPRIRSNVDDVTP